MEYYERIVDQMFADTDSFVQRLEKRGNISIFTAELHRFIGAAISTRSEVISVLHLLDKPDVVWDDPGAERIYQELLGAVRLGGPLSIAGAEATERPRIAQLVDRHCARPAPSCSWRRRSSFDLGGDRGQPHPDTEPLRGTRRAVSFKLS